MAWVGSGTGRIPSARAKRTPGEADAGLEGRPLVRRLGLDEALFLQHRDDRRHAVVAQAATEE